MRMGDWVFPPLIYLCGLGFIALAAYLVFVLINEARPAFAEFGFGFLFDNVWNPLDMQFGALATIFGTIVTALVALAIAIPISQGAAIFLAELAPPWLRTPASYLIETLAAIPSVIFGLWALFILVPVIRDPVQIFLVENFSWIPLFDGPAFGVSILAAGIILSIMILPIITAVTLVFGISFRISESLFDPGPSIASAIASQFSEASAGVFIASLVYLALVLFVISLLINIAARLLVGRLVRVPGRVRE
mgnify:CR=1 FL=1